MKIRSILISIFLVGLAFTSIFTITRNIELSKELKATQENLENVLEKYPNSADAHYGIGVIYEKQGNLVKARAEWRQTLKIQVNHQGALQKLNSN